MIPTPEVLTDAAKYLVIILSYGVIGGAIKYIDQAFDVGVFSKKFATIVAIPTGLLMGALMVLDSYSATIFLAIVIAVGVTQKIDVIAFRLGVFALLIVPVFFQKLVEIQWIPFGLLVLAGVVDEYSNDWADSMFNGGKGKNYYKKKNILKRISTIMFLQRPMMKVFVIILAIAGFIHPIYILAFLSFDAMYSLIAWLSIRYRIYKISGIPAPAIARVSSRKNLSLV